MHHFRMTNIQLICPSTNINSSLFRGNGLTAADIATECKLQVDTLSVFAVVLGTNDKDPNTKYPHSYLPSLPGGTTLYVEGTPTAQGAAPTGEFRPFFILFIFSLFSSRCLQGLYEALRASQALARIAAFYSLTKSHELINSHLCSILVSIEGIDPYL